LLLTWSVSQSNTSGASLRSRISFTLGEILSSSSSIKVSDGDSKFWSKAYISKQICRIDSNWLLLLKDSDQSFNNCSDLLDDSDKIVIDWVICLNSLITPSIAFCISSGSFFNVAIN
jgi:predicted nuclease of restriction endonuclease-like RecB superfamily